jgi:hypothetical protein
VIKKDMPWYKIELNVGISDKLASYIQTTYGGGGQTIKVFDRQGNYTKIIAFANSLAAVNAALTDIRNRLVEVIEVDYSPGAGD